MRRFTPSMGVALLALILALALASTAQAGTSAVVALQVVDYDMTERVLRSTGTAADGCRVEVKKTTAEAAGSIDLFWVKQRLAWCWKTVHGVSWVTGPWWTPVCGGRKVNSSSATRSAFKPGSRGRRFEATTKAA